MARRHAYLRRARHWLANRGWRGFLEELWYRARLMLQGRPVPGRENGSTAIHPFDRAYGVDTGGLIWGEALVRSRNQEAAFWATGYYGISPSAFTSALRRLSLNWPRYTFIDIGCGKGRALLLALRFPFHAVLGVELSPELAAVAQQNLRSFQAPWRQQNVSAQALEADATDFRFPSGPLVVFLYHPFAAPVMQRFLAHLESAAQEEAREIFVLYANPELGTLVGSVATMEWLWKESFALTQEEGEADRFGSHGEVFSAYRLPPSPPSA